MPLAAFLAQVSVCVLMCQKRLEIAYPRLALFCTLKSARCRHLPALCSAALCRAASEHHTSITLPAAGLEPRELSVLTERHCRLRAGAV